VRAKTNAAKLRPGNFINIALHIRDCIKPCVADGFDFLHTAILSYIIAAAILKADLIASDRNNHDIQNDIFARYVGEINA